MHSLRMSQENPDRPEVLHNETASLAMSNKHITVITSTFNALRDLPRTAESIRQQAARVQWIVADGGSTDGTVEWLEKNQDIVDVWFSEPDRGIYDAWNKALAHARGEWVLFLGADDCLIGNDSILRIEKELSCADGYNIVIFPVELVDPVENRSKVVNLPDSINMGDIAELMNICHQGVIQRTSDLLHLGGFDSELKVCGDYDVLLRSTMRKPALLASCSPPIQMTLAGVSSTLKGAAVAYAEMGKIQKRVLGKSSYKLHMRKLRIQVLCAILPSDLMRRVEKYRIKKMVS